MTAANGGMQELKVSDLQIRKLFTERVATRPGVADMLVEQRRSRASPAISQDALTLQVRVALRGSASFFAAQVVQVYGS